jgi:hypothetical protein
MDLSGPTFLGVHHSGDPCELTDDERTPIANPFAATEPQA